MGKHGSMIGDDEAMQLTKIKIDPKFAYWWPVTAHISGLDRPDGRDSRRVVKEQSFSQAKQVSSAGTD